MSDASSKHSVASSSLYERGCAHHSSAGNVRGRKQRLLFRRAAEMFALGAEHGDPRCDLALGQMALKGEYIERNVSFAVERIQASARLGHPPAIQQLAILYAAGNGVPKDPKLAADLLRRAELLAGARAA
jgi:TPR repeat protein